MKKSKSLIALALASVMMFTAACGTTGKPDTASNADGSATAKIARVNSSGGEPGSLQPGLSQGTHESWILDHMFKGLYTKTPGGEIDLAIAESAETSDDGLVWTFKLRDFKWSSGNEGSANDFVQSVLFTLNPESAAQYASNLWIIEGGEAYNSGKGNAEDVGIKAIDDKTLEITLTTPVAYLPDLLTNTFFYPIDAKNAEEYKDWYMSPDNYSSNGPFTLTKWAPKEEIVISKNENYYDVDKTNLDGIKFSLISDKTTEWQMYEQDEIDLVYSVMPDVIEKLSSENNPELTLSNELATYYYHMNVETVPFNNVKVRKALNMGMDRKAIVENVTKGGQIPAYSITPPGVLDETGENYNDSVGKLFEENYDEARALLAEGLAEEGIDPATWSFTILYNTDETHKKVAEAIQSMWSQNLGVNCNLENLEFQTLLQKRKSGDYDVARAGWIGDYADPMTFLELFTSYSEFNHSRWSSAEYDELIAKSMIEQDPAVRMEELRKAEKIAVDEVGIMPIYFYSKSVATKPSLTGVYSPINKYPNFEFADLAE